MSYEKLIGEQFTTKHSGMCTVKSVENLKKITVQFEDGFETTCTLQHLKEGSVLNPYHPKIYGVGFIGEGEYLCKINGKIHPYYDAWRGCLRRCYDHKWQDRFPRYKGCTFYEGWYNYQDFSKWSDQQIFYPGYKLDKDLIVYGNNVYGPETCVYLPNELNCIIAEHWLDRALPKGVNKVLDFEKSKKKYTANCNRVGRGYTVGYFETVEEAAEFYILTKENYVKERAMVWKDLISSRAFEALMVWKVPA